MFPPIAFAQTGTSNIQGNVSDAATKVPAADAVITVTSPAVQGEQVEGDAWERRRYQQHTADRRHARPLVVRIVAMPPTLSQRALR